MNDQHVSVNNKCLPDATDNTPLEIISKEEWSAMHDALTLALDAMGEGPQDVDHAFLWNNIIHLRIAHTTAHKYSQKGA